MADDGIILSDKDISEGWDKFKGWVSNATGFNDLNRAGRAEDLYGGVGSTALPGYQTSYHAYGRLQSQLGNRDPRRIAESGFRKGQLSLGNQLAMEAQGQGIGQQLIRQQAQQSADRGMQQQLAMQAGARPGSQAMAARNAAMASGQMQSAVGGQAALAGGQYQLGAMDQYGQFLQGARAQDQGLEGMRLQSHLGQTQLNDAARMEMLRQKLAAQQAEQQGRIAQEQIRAQRYGALMGAPTEGEQKLGAITGLILGGAQLATKKG